MLLLFTYFIVGVAWGTYAAYKTRKTFGGVLNVIMSFIINAAVWPVGMVFAFLPDRY